MVALISGTTLSPATDETYEYTLVGGETWAAYWQGCGVNIDLLPDPTTTPDFVIPLSSETLENRLDFTQLTFSPHRVVFKVKPSSDNSVTPYFRFEVR